MSNREEHPLSLVVSSVAELDKYKLCRNCTYSRVAGNCVAPQNELGFSVVHGYKVYGPDCIELRNDATKCGIEAAWFVKHNHGSYVEVDKIPPTKVSLKNITLDKL